MRRTLLSLLLIVFLPAFVFANGNGAQVFVDPMTDTGLVYEGESVLLFFTTLPDFCGSDEDWMARLKVVENPNSVHWQVTGFYYIYVFDPMTPEEFIAAGGPCTLLQDERLVAEGIAKGFWVDNDWFGEKNTYSWGWGFNGTIYDLTGDCDSGMVELNYHWRARCNKGNGCKLNVKGPRYWCYMD
jgi:hypothetical protein